MKETRERDLWWFGEDRERDKCVCLVKKVSGFEGFVVWNAGVKKENFFRFLFVDVDVDVVVFFVVLQESWFSFLS